MAIDTILDAEEDRTAVFGCSHCGQEFDSWVMATIHHDQYCEPMHELGEVPCEGCGRRLRIQENSGTLCECGRITWWVQLKVDNVSPIIRTEARKCISRTS